MEVIYHDASENCCDQWPTSGVHAQQKQTPAEKMAYSSSYGKSRVFTDVENWTNTLVGWLTSWSQADSSWRLQSVAQHSRIAYVTMVKSDDTLVTFSVTVGADG